MNTDTGRIYEMGPDFDPVAFYPVIGPGADAAFEGAQSDTQEQLIAARIADLDRQLSADEVAAMRDMARGERVVRVSDAVAQTMLLGAREQKRRKRRRVAEKEARKRNR